MNPIAVTCKVTHRRLCTLGLLLGLADLGLLWERFEYTHGVSEVTHNLHVPNSSQLLDPHVWAGTLDHLSPTWFFVLALYAAWIWTTSPLHRRYHL